jgi:F420H(2)-dependent quinone reductase
MKTATSKRQLKMETPIIVFWYRLFARWTGGTNLLLLTTIGRKTGRRRTVPVVYKRVESGFLIVAANVGLDAHPGWFLNLQHNPQVHIQVGGARMAVSAQEVASDEREKLWADWIQSNPGYKDFQAKTARKFPMVILKPLPAS